MFVPKPFDDLTNLLGTHLLYAGGQCPLLLVGQFGWIFRQPCFLPELRRQYEAVTDAMIEIAVIQAQCAIGRLSQHVAEDLAVLRLSTQAEPLRLMLLRVRNKPKNFRDTRIKPR